MLNKNVDRKCCIGSLVKKGDDPQCHASAHLTRDKETESASKLNRSEEKPSATSQSGVHI